MCEVINEIFACSQVFYKYFEYGTMIEYNSSNFFLSTIEISNNILPYFTKKLCSGLQNESYSL